MTVIGLVLFFRVFFSMASHISDPMFFHSHFRSASPNERLVPFQSGAVGVILAGLGGVLVKVGLGFSLVGSSSKITNWLLDLIYADRREASCPKCNSGNRQGTSSAAAAVQGWNSTKGAERQDS